MLFNEIDFFLIKKKNDMSGAKRKIVKVFWLPKVNVECA
jgi:hypothetical protein